MQQSAIPRAAGPSRSRRGGIRHLRAPPPVAAATAVLAVASVAGLVGGPAFFGLHRPNSAADGRQPSVTRQDGQHGVPALGERMGAKLLTEADALAVAELRRRADTARLQSVPEGLLQRCCAAARNNGEAAYARLRDIVRWRAREDVDRLPQDPRGAAAERWYRGLLHYGLPGQDRQGRAVMIEAIGQWDMDELDKAARGMRDQMLQAHIVVCETLLKQAQDVASARALQGRQQLGGLTLPAQRTPGFVAILDMDGISLRQNLLAYPEVLNVLREVSKINARYYPEAVEHVFVVNAPRLFQSIWRVLSPFVLPSSGVKVDVLPTGEFGRLLRECGRECLPTQLGGMLAADTPPYQV